MITNNKKWPEEKKGVAPDGVQFVNSSAGSVEFSDEEPITASYGRTFLGIPDEFVNPAENLAEKTKKEAVDALEHHYILPLRFERGEHMETIQIQGMPVAIGLLSNATFKDLEPGQKAAIGVAGARFTDNMVDFTILNFNIDNLKQRLKVPELLLQSRKQSGSSVLESPEGLVDSLKVHIDPKEKTIFTEASEKATHCFLLRGRDIYELAGSTQQTLQSGDIVLIFTKEIIDSLVHQVTRKAYMQTVPALTTPTESLALENLPPDFVEQETANQIRGLVADSQTEAYVSKDDQKVLQKKLSPEKLFRVLSAIYKKHQIPKSADKIVTDAFALYQIP